MATTKDPKAAALKAVEDQEKIVARTTSMLERCRSAVEQTQAALTNAEAEQATQERLLAYAQSHPLLAEDDVPSEPVEPPEPIKATTMVTGAADSVSTPH